MREVLLLPLPPPMGEKHTLNLVGAFFSDFLVKDISDLCFLRRR
jgi:hypothetical protein